MPSSNTSRGWPLLSTDFSPLSSGSASPVAPAAPRGSQWSRDHRPPRGLYLPKGPVSNVRFGDTLPPSGGRTVSQRLGLAYEQRVQDVLAAIYAERFFCNVPILYEDRAGLHRCIPDGVLRLDETTILIVEIKLTHTERAWWQLERLYTPVIRAMVGPSARILRCEICRSYDPAVVFPSPAGLVNSLHRLSDDRVGVLQWRI